MENLDELSGEELESLPEEVKRFVERGESFDVYSANGQDFYVKKPTKTVVKYYLDQVSERGADLYRIHETIVKMSAIYPTAEKLDKISENFPAIYVSLSNSIMRGAGLINFTQKGLFTSGN